MAILGKTGIWTNIGSLLVVVLISGETPFSCVMKIVLAVIKIPL
jgi:hypothetical protein